MIRATLTFKRAAWHGRNKNWRRETRTSVKHEKESNCSNGSKKRRWKWIRFTAGGTNGVGFVGISSRDAKQTRQNRINRAKFSFERPGPVSFVPFICANAFRWSIEVITGRVVRPWHRILFTGDITRAFHGNKTGSDDFTGVREIYTRVCEIKHRTSPEF